MKKYVTNRKQQQPLNDRLMALDWHIRIVAKTMSNFNKIKATNPFIDLRVFNVH